MVYKYWNVREGIRYNRKLTLGDHTHLHTNKHGIFLISSFQYIGNNEIVIVDVKNILRPHKKVNEIGHQKRKRNMRWKSSGWKSQE